MVYILQFIICGVVLGLHLYFRKQHTKGVTSAGIGVNATAIALVALVVLFVFFPGLFHRSGIDTLSSDIAALRRVGTEAGDYLAGSPDSGNVLIVRYNVDSGSPDGRDAIWEVQQALVDGVQQAEGMGQVREIRIDVPEPGSVTPNGMPVPWFTSDELQQVMKQVSKGDVVILLTGLPYGVTPGKALQGKEGVRLIILSSNANELMSGMRSGTLVGGILERRISEMDKDGRYVFLTPQKVSSQAGG